jgi:hypothetical protein
MYVVVGEQFFYAQCLMESSVPSKKNTRELGKTTAS